MSVKFAMVSLGCSKNLVDSEQMLYILDSGGFELVEDEAQAEVIIVNTCAFIDSAKQESIDCILEMAEYKKSAECKHIVVTGCMAQRYKGEILAELPEVDAVVGVNEFDKIADIIKDLPHINTVYCGSAPMASDNLPRIRTTPEYTAYLKIAEGCDNCCTYCAIPSIRGRYRSRKMEDILEEAERMAEDGGREVIVIAQDTTRYGKDLYGEYRLAELVRRLCEIDKLKWVRLHYCYPELVSDELIEAIAGNEKVCRYLDIPIQHASDSVLRRMNRRASKAEMLRLFGKLRAVMPDITLRTTLIVGFPGETDEDVAELNEFIKEVRFDKLGVFTYSREEGTPAAGMAGQVDEEDKLRRQEVLLLTQNDISADINRAKAGTVREVLVEGYDAVIKRHYGRTAADSVEVDGKVFFTSKRKPGIGEFVSVEIDDAMDYDLTGREVDR